MPDTGPERRLAEIEDELYGVAPAEFIDRRDEAVRAAKQGGDRELAEAIATLRKPTAAAWALDSFARARPAAIDALLELGDRLRDAVGRGDGGAIRELMRERTRVVTSTMRAVRDHADEQGEPLSAAVAGQVEQSLRAALVSASDGDRLRRGVLATALDESGLDVMAAPAGRATKRTADRSPPSAADRRQRANAEQRVAAAEDVVERAGRTLDTSARRRAELEGERDDLRRRLDEVDRRLRDERERESEADEQLRAARAELRAARSALGRVLDSSVER